MRTNDAFLKIALALHAMHGQLFIYQYSAIDDEIAEKELSEKFKAFVGCLNDFQQEMNRDQRFRVIKR